MAEEYSALYPLRLIWSQTISLLLLPNLLLIIIAFADPYDPKWASALLVPLIIMDVLGLPIVLFPARMQVFHLLFLGLLGILGSAAFAAAANKLAYAVLEIESSWFLIASILWYIVVIGLLYIIHLKLLYAGKYSLQNDEGVQVHESASSGLKKSRRLILVCSGVGVLIGSVLIHIFGGYDMKVMLIIAFVFLFSLVYMLIASNLHNYILYIKYH